MRDSSRVGVAVHVLLADQPLEGVGEVVEAGEVRVDVVHRGVGAITEGDILLAGDLLLAGTGFRTTHAAHRELQELFGYPVISLELVDPRYYHLDTALTVLDERTVAYLPEAFSPGSRAVLRRLFPDAVIATPGDAEVFGLNAVSDGLHVVLPAGTPQLAGRLRERGYRPVEVDLSELRRAGGGPKCCTLRLRQGKADK